ncbi:MAG: peptidase [Planctomycetota bacterium]
MAYLKPTSRIGCRSAACRGFLLFGFAAIAFGSHAATIQLTDGRILTGELGKTAGVAEDPLVPGTSAGAIRTTPIIVVEDGLRRTYVHSTKVREVIDQRDDPPVRIKVWQNEAKRGASLGVIGQPSNITPLDEYGRRIVSLPSDKGAIDVIQGVTEVTPVYTRLRGLRAKPRSYLWDMRVATSSLPRKTLQRVLSQAVPRDDFDARMQVVRLYLQAERYRDAARELATVRDHFADRPGVAAADIDDNLRRLRELAARKLLDEIELRRDAGQFVLARTLLERFPADGVAGDTLQRIRELLDEDDATQAKRERLLDQLDATVENLAEPAAQAIAMRIAEEIRQRLSPASADRLAAFTQLADGGALSAEELAAVAISGWLLGSNQAIDSLPTALSLVRARDDVRQYLSEADPKLRDATFLSLRDSAVAEVPRIAELIARMEPPLPLVDPVEDESLATADAGSADTPVGVYERTVRVGKRDVRWVLQLPPEYDPLRRYPTMVTLGELGTPPERQLDYWAGAVRPEVGRVGQARRRGCIVLAVDWSRPDQLRYEYTAEEHAAVLVALRDAMRRTSIDPDRVYLTGHGAGADVAWDLSLAHPDHWAGCLPFLGVADRYCGWYWRNAEHVPWRIVLGELDGDKVNRNARELDRYLRPRFDATVVEYRGRGYDPLSDDIQRAFDWMGRKRRGAPPEEFECSTMRPWDNYFWWIEASDLPPKAMTAPAEWPPNRGVRAATVRGRKFAGNKLGVFTGAEKVTVWLSPELIDFEEPVEIEHNGRRLVPRNERIDPSLRTLLEDVRTRADRLRPYWARVESL